MPIKHSSNSLYPPIVPQWGYPNALLIHGRVGYAYVFKQYGTRRVICKYSYPYQPRTPAQLLVRQKFYNAVLYWQGFNDQTKDFYNAKEYPKQMSGYNRYIRMYLLYS